MGFSNYFPFLTAVLMVLVLLVQNSNGESIGQNYQEDIDDFDSRAAIGGPGNIVINLGQDAINVIKREAEYFKGLGANAKAVDLVTEGLIMTIKLIAENGDNTCDCIDKYKNMEMFNPEDAIDDIDRSIRAKKQAIYRSGAPVLQCMGAVSVLVPGTSKEKLREYFNPLQDSGTAIFNSMDATQTLATFGIKSTKRSRDLGLIAGHSAVIAGTSALNSCFINAAQRVFSYLVDVATGKTNDSNASADVLSSRAKAVARDNETIAVINQIDYDIENAFFAGLPGNVLNEIREGALADIIASATGIINALKTLQIAKELSLTNPTKAIEELNNGFEIARKSCIAGSVKGYIGFGGAAYLFGQNKVFASAIEIIENSRIDSISALLAARNLAIDGIISGGESTNHCYTAAQQAVEAVEIELFTKISNAVKVSLKILQAVVKMPGLI